MTGPQNDLGYTQKAIVDVTLGASDAVQYLTALTQTFPELARLNGTPEKPYSNSKADGGTVQTLSQIVLGAQHAEYDRTGFSLSILHSVIHGSTERTFNLGINPLETRLAFQQFVYDAIKVDGAPQKLEAAGDKLQAINPAWIDAAKLGTLVTLVGIHDLAKIKEFAQDAAGVLEKAGIAFNEADHDEIFIKLLSEQKVRDQAKILVPTFFDLSEEQRQRVLGSFMNGINPGRIYQLESGPGEFEPAAQIDKGLFKVFHALDMAGVRGNAWEPLAETQTAKTQDGAAPFFWNKFMHQGFVTTLAQCADVADGTSDPAKAYDTFLQEVAKGMKVGKPVAEFTPEDRAAVRLAKMSRLKSGNDGVTFDQALAYLKTNPKLASFLAATGYGGQGPAIDIGYAPDLSDAVNAAYKDAPLEKKLATFGQVMTMLYEQGARVLAKGGAELASQGHIVIEAQALKKPLTETPDQVLAGGFAIKYKDGFSAVPDQDAARPPAPAQKAI